MGALTRSRCLARLLAFSILTVGSAATASGTFAGIYPQQPSITASRKNAAILGGLSQLEQIAAGQQNASITAQQSANYIYAAPEPTAQPDFTGFRSQPDFTTPSRPISSDRPDIFGSVALAVSTHLSTPNGGAHRKIILMSKDHGRR